MNVQLRCSKNLSLLKELECGKRESDILYFLNAISDVDGWFLRSFRLYLRQHNLNAHLTEIYKPFLQ